MPGLNASLAAVTVPAARAKDHHRQRKHFIRLAERTQERDAAFAAARLLHIGQSDAYHPYQREMAAWAARCIALGFPEICDKAYIGTLSSAAANAREDALRAAFLHALCDAAKEYRGEIEPIVVNRLEVVLQNSATEGLGLARRALGLVLAAAARERYEAVAVCRSFAEDPSLNRVLDDIGALYAIAAGGSGHALRAYHMLAHVAAGHSEPEILRRAAHVSKKFDADARPARPAAADAPLSAPAFA